MSPDSSRQNQSERTEAAGNEVTSKPVVTLGDYRLVRQLGSGGMGTVYEAVQVRLDKQVAVKVLASNRLKDADSVARFEREMKAVGKLNHPNIIQAFDAREENGVHFLVLEFIEGCDLGEVSNAMGQLPIAAACEMIRQAAEGLQNAHEHGLVHRDIKPSNLFLSLSRNAQKEITAATVKVLDLGLALLNGEGQGEELTTTGQVMGTLDYIAPEQIQDTHKVDIRADLYALGCTLYKLLTGKAPFADSQGAIKKMRAHADLPVPDIKELRADIPAGLASLIQNLLEKDPDQRFKTPSELVIALQPFCKGGGLVEIGKQLSVRATESSVLEQGTVDGISRTGGTETIVKTTSEKLDLSYVVTTTEPASDQNDGSSTKAFNQPRKSHVGQWIGMAAALLICIPVAYYIYTSATANRLSKEPGWSEEIEVEPTSMDRELLQNSLPTTSPLSPEIAAQNLSQQNYVLSFDGLDDHIVVESLSLDAIDLNQPLTIELSARMRVNSTCNLISWLGREWIALYQASERWGVGRLKSEKPYLIEGASVAVTGKWTKLAAVWNGTWWTLYVDGQRQSTVGNGFELEPTSGGLYIGGVPMNLLTGHSGTRWFAGEIDEVRISTSVRYTKETYDLTDRFLPDQETLLLYHFDEGEGTTAKDSSGHEHDGKVVGAVFKSRDPAEDE